MEWESEQPQYGLNPLGDRMRTLFSGWIYADSSEMKSFSAVWLFASPWTACFLCPWDFPGKNTGVGASISFSRGSSWPRDRIWVSHTAVRLFTVWVTKDALTSWIKILSHFKYEISLNMHRVRHNWSDLAAAAAAVKWSCSVVSNSLQLHGL